MALEQYPKLQQIIDNGYEFDFGNYISEGIDTFKQNIGGFVGYTAVFLLCNVVAAFIPVVGSLAMLLLTPIFLAGFYLTAHLIKNNQAVEFKDFFRGFDYAGQLIAMYVVMILLIIVLMIPMIVGLTMTISSSAILPEDISDNPFWIFSQISLWMFVLIVPMVYFVIAWRWAPMFIVFYQMGFWDAMEASRRITTKKWWLLFAFAIVIGILGSIGYIALLVGFLFTYPAAMCMDYAAFRDVTKLQQKENVMDNIEEHLVE